ncbi:MAG: carboxypeptidase-like regulatory domain-containing protein [Candidatus Diapherotrites archaeon]
MDLNLLKEEIKQGYDLLKQKVPFFPYSIILLLLLISTGFILTIMQEKKEETEITALVKDNENKAIQGATLSISYEEKGEAKEKTLTTNEQGKASFLVPKNSVVQISANAKNFKEQKKTIIAEQSTTISFLLEKTEENKSITVLFTGPDGKKLTGKKITANLSCTGNAVFQNPQLETNNGEITLQVPENCGNVRITANADGYKQGFALFQSRFNELKLETIEIQKGTIELDVKDEDNKFLDDIQVSLLQNNVPIGLSQQTYFGKATFNNIPTGKYTISFQDIQGNYASETIDIDVSGTIRKEVILSKDIKLIAKAKVLQNNIPVKEAKVMLYTQQGNLVAAQNTNENGIATFSIKDQGQYYLVSTKENMIPQRTNFSTSAFPKGSTKEFLLNMRQCTQETCGILKIRVIDEDKLPIENAIVSLVNENGLLAYETYATTDFNGVAIFKGVEKAKLNAIAQKGFAQGKSEYFEIDPLKENFVEFTITIGYGNVIVSIANSNEQLQNVAAEIFSSDNKSLGVLPISSNGQNSMRIKADKAVYVVFRKEGYSKYYTTTKQVLPNKEIRFNGIIEREITGENPKITYLGFFNENGQRVEALSSGNNYIAKFLLEIPDKEFETTGIFFRTGDSKNISNDPLNIEDITAPASTLSSGDTYDFETQEDEENEKSNSGKWVKAEWQNKKNTKHEVEVKLRVKQGIAPNTELPLYYRAYAVSSGKYYRDPYDSELGTDKEKPRKKEMYALSNEIRLLEGIKELCEQDFCLSYRLLDKSSNLYVQKPYTILPNSPYTLEFTITNNSQTNYSKASFSIEAIGENFSLKTYSIRNANNVVFSSDSETKTTNQLEAGEFSKNKSIRGTLELEPKSVGRKTLELKIRSERETRFNETIEFIVSTENQMRIELLQQDIIGLIQNKLEVKVMSNSNELVEGAKVLVKRISPDKSESTYQKTTNAQGLAIIDLPAMPAGTKIIVWAEKQGMVSNTIEKNVTIQAISFRPEKISTSLNILTKEETTNEIELQNLAKIELEIRKVLESINSKGILDETKMSNYLKRFQSTRLGQEQKEISILSSLGIQAQYITKPKKVNGNIIIEYGPTNDKSVSWILKIPYEATINLAEMPKNIPCITISNYNWQDSTIDNKATFEFEIENNCLSEDNKEINLNGILANIEWQGKDGKVALVEISLTDLETNQVSKEVLEQGISKRLNEHFSYGRPYIARLTLVPKPESIGKVAEFKVKLSGEIITNAGKQQIEADKLIEAKVFITNIDRCIKFNPHPEEGIIIRRNQNEAEFSIDTRDCGPVEIEIRFCGEENNYMCRGGTNEGGIIVTPTRVSTINSETKTIKVQRQEIPGFYGLTIEARPKGFEFKKIAEYDVIIEPETQEYFTLDKYQFNLVGQGSKDYATLTNQMLEEKVEVRANLCDWKEASKGLGTPEKIAIGLAGAAAGAALGYGFAVLVGISATGIGAIVGALIMLMLVFMTLFGEDPCEQWQTNTLQDYVINLTGTADKTSLRYVEPDALPLEITEAKIRAGWNLNVSDADQKISRQNPNGKQTAGIVFENLGLEKQEPTYAILTLKAKEHIHGDPTHTNASVQCGEKGSNKGDFGMYWINPGYCGRKGQVYDTTYTQKVHVKFNTTKETTYIPKIEFDTYDCQSGTEIGRTGKGALPKVKFNWSWKENLGGISAKECDATNPNSIYCDATQFTIALNKKLYALHEFLAENNYDLGCPNIQVPQDQEITRSNYEVPQNQIGLKELKTEETPQGVKVILKSKNNTAENQSIKVEAKATNLLGIEEKCELQIMNISPEQEKTNECEIILNEDGAYSISTEIIEATTDNYSQNKLVAAIYYGDPTKAENQILCTLKTTETLGGKPQILRFIEGKNVKWTTLIPNEKALADLLVFDAYLMKDNYSKEFFKDFAEYYTKTAFSDTDHYFSPLFSKLMEQEKFIVKNKYDDTTELPGPGLYRVEIAVYYTEGNWKIVNERGEPQGYVSILLHKLKDPLPDSIFYYMPIDGKVGEKGQILNRQNYGTKFENKTNEEIRANESAIPTTFKDTTGNGIINLEINKNSDFYSLNVSPATRGMILEIQATRGNNAKMTYQPSIATPLIIKTTNNNLTPFTTYYTTMENQTPIKQKSLTYWEGLGNCLDFSGLPINETFYYKQDRQGKESDKITDYENVYAIDWEKVNKVGNVYLRTILYTDPKKETIIKAIGEKSVFITLQEESRQVNLDGIKGMKNNSRILGENGVINSLEDIFTMVEKGEVCVTNTGKNSKFFWNPKKIYTQRAQEKSINDLINEIEAQCIK